MDPDDIDDGFWEPLGNLIEKRVCFECTFCKAILPYSKANHNCPFPGAEDEGISDRLALNVFITTLKKILRDRPPFVWVRKVPDVPDYDYFE